MSDTLISPIYSWPERFGEYQTFLARILRRGKFSTGVSIYIDQDHRVRKKPGNTVVCSYIPQCCQVFVLYDQDI